MHENAARALQYYEDLPRRSGRPDLRLVDAEPRTRRRREAEPKAGLARDDATDALSLREDAPDPTLLREDAFDGVADGPEVHVITLDAPAEPLRSTERRRSEPRQRPAARRGAELAAPRRPAFPARQRQTVAPRIAGRPDRVAMWAVLLGFFLTAVAAATGHG